MLRRRVPKGIAFGSPSRKDDESGCVPEGAPRIATHKGAFLRVGPFSAFAETDSNFAVTRFCLAGTLGGKTIHRIVLLHPN